MMSRSASAKADASFGRQLLLLPTEVFRELGMADGPGLAERLPFVGADATAGVENELQAAVIGSAHTTDLPLTIQTSDFCANLLKRFHRGELPRTVLDRLDKLLEERPEMVWENSWVRLPRRTLRPATAAAFEQDLLADKTNPTLGRRSDWASFYCRVQGEEFLRLPISYLLKLSLVQVLADLPTLPAGLKETAHDLVEAFISDNTSPETNSFYVVTTERPGGLGRAVARETAKRFLLTQLLIEYSRETFELDAHGQRPLVYFAPTPPRRQQALNECVSDAFYRELFMNPCLSGWDRGEEKKRYMHLCHQVLSRSHLNTVAKLRDAGIVNHNLVVLPNTSNISLANNGTHLSLGSRKLSAALAVEGHAFGPHQEKLYGDLVIKFVEHFLPLFVGLYSAAPRRLAFADFHPERVLGFLPHELDYTHLRMLWRRWKEKADLRFCGRRWTPFGPCWMDRWLGGLFRLRGDFVPDFRLIDYLVCLHSTEQSPGLDGRPGNGDRLKRDLEESGVFDRRLALYLLYRQREHAHMGFTGFEGRFHSLFPSLHDDLAPATELQALVTALAYKLIVQRRLTHSDIPDDPATESERRQIFFAAALEVPTVFVREKGQNMVLQTLIRLAPNVRSSRRYCGHWRVQLADYRHALLRYLRTEASDLIEVMGLGPQFEDLVCRLEAPDEFSAWGRLLSGFLPRAQQKKPVRVPADEFNAAIESYFRGDLRRQQIVESLDLLKADLESDSCRRFLDQQVWRQWLDELLAGRSPAEWVREAGGVLLAERLKGPALLRLIHVLLVSIHYDVHCATARYQHGIPCPS